MLDMAKLQCGYGPANRFTLGTPMGEYELICCPRGIHSLDHKGPGDLQADWSVSVAIKEQEYPDNGYTYKPALACVDWLQQYFSGTRGTTKTSLPTICHLNQTNKKADSFHQRVWQTLAEQVQFGQTVTYGQLANLCGSRRAAQAVGQAMRNNPVSIVVPCHRVVLSSGKTGNYSGGKKNNLKRLLLQHEGVTLSDM